MDAPEDSALAAIALRQILTGAALTVGKLVGGEVAGEVVSFLSAKFNDAGSRLPLALKKAHDNAWRAFEIALGGDSLWDRCGRMFVSREDQAFREQVREFVTKTPLYSTSKSNPEIFAKALAELKALRRNKDAALTFDMAALSQQLGTLARFAEAQEVIDAEWALLQQTARLMSDRAPHLFKIVGARPAEKSRPSLLACAVRYYFRREVEADRELFQSLTIDKLDDLRSRYDDRFEALTAAMGANAQKFEFLLGDIAARVGGMEAKLDEILRHLRMERREVRPGDSMSVRDEGDQRRVDEAVNAYRTLPSGVRRENPKLLDAVGKLEIASGRFAEAEKDFKRVAEMESDPARKAEAHHNAYRAALERDDFESAFDELKKAVALDAARFAPFPFDRFEPLRLLGAGGFGVVFLCQHAHLKKPVVVKTLPTEELDRGLDAVFAEATALEELSHPGIIRVRDCGYADAAKTRPYLVMDYFEGVNLNEYVRQNGPLDADVMRAVAAQVADAMKTAHACGILHRDIKPANLLVRRDESGWRVKVIDFGLALRPTVLSAQANTTARAAKTTLGKSIAGTINYAAPEQMNADEADKVGPHSDVWGFAKTCYYGLFGTPSPDDEEREMLPDGWRSLLSGCTRRDVGRRIADFAEVGKRLEAIETAPPPPPVVERIDVIDPPPPPPPPGETEKVIFTFLNRGARARGYPLDDGRFVVLAESPASPEEGTSLSPQLAALRREMLASGAMVADGDALRLTRDQTFANSSTAATVLAGSPRGGPGSWLGPDGRTLREHLKIDGGKGGTGEKAESLTTLRDRARTHREKSRYKQAVADLSAAIRRDPTFLADVVERGEVYALMGETDKAIHDFSQVLLRGDRSSRVLCARGRAYATKKLGELALSDFGAALGIAPESADAYHERGLALMDLDRPAEALADFADACRLRPDDTRHAVARGRAELASRDHAAALKTFSDLVAMYPTLGEAHLGRALVQIAKGNLRDAHADLVNATKESPKLAEAFAVRARVRMELRQFKRAASDFEKAQKFYPRDASLHAGKARAHLELGEYDDVLASAKEAMKLGDKSAAVYLDRGRAYAATGQPGRAISDLTEAISLDPSLSEAYLSRAWEYHTKNRHDEALADADECIRRGYELAEAHELRGSVLVEKKEYDAAILALDEAIRLYGRNAWSLSTRGEAHYGKQDYDRAVADFAAAIKLDPEEALHYDGRAKSLNKLGRRAEATADRDRAKALRAAEETGPTAPPEG